MRHCHQDSLAQAINGNILLKNEDILRKHNKRACTYIPARAVETIGVGYNPVSIPNEELFKKLTST